MSFNALNTGRRPLTRETRTQTRVRRKTGEEASPGFLSTPFPLPFAATQMVVSGCIRWGLHPLALRRYPSTPSTAKVGFAPLIPPLRPPALNAATKWHTGADAAPVFLWMPFPHPRCGYADGASGLRCLVLDDSTGRLPGRPPALNATKKRGTPTSPQTFGHISAFTRDGF